MQSEAAPPWLKWLTIYAMFGLSSTVFTLLSTSTEDAETGTRIVEAAPLWYNIYCGSFLLVMLGLIASRIDNIIYILHGNIALTVLLLYMVAGCAWSLDAERSFVEVFKIGIALFFGLFLAGRFTDKEILSIFAATMKIIVVSSFLISIFMPDYGIDSAGQWRGAYTHKNLLAIGMNMGFVAFSMAAVYVKKGRWVNISFAFLAALLVILSRSGTGLVLLMLMLLYPIYIPYLRQSTVFLLTSMVVLGAVIGLIYQLTGGVELSGILLDALGKDATLSGRTEAWDGIFYSMTDYRSSHLYFGYGAQSWTITPGGEIISGYNELSAPPDDTYIDVLLRFGLVGSFLYALVLGKAVLLSFRELRSSNPALGNLFIVIMMILFFNGISESINAVHFLWMLFALILASPYIRREPETETGETHVAA